MQGLQVKLLQFIRRHELLAGGERAVVGLSGGADSVALVLLLTELARSGALDVRLRLAHLNHGLRGAESDQDEAFCRAFAAERGLALAVERADVASAASLHHRSVEAEARRMRYEFLGRVAEQVGAGAVATGHHADDVAESVLLRLLRGASVLGLGAMAPQRRLSAERPGIRLVRPLLALRRQELVDYLGRCGQPHRTDSSNTDLAYLRNRVRHELIPALRRDFATFSVESLCALNESAIEAEALIEGLLDAAWGEVCRERGDREVVLDAEAFGRLAPAVRKAAARRAVESLDARAAAALRAEHYAELAALAQAPAGAQVSLPGGCLARREHGAVYVARRSGAGGIEPRVLPVPGAVELPEVGMSVSCRLLPAGDVGPLEAAQRASDDEVFVSAAGLEGGLMVRSRRAGDRFHPLGAPGAAKLKDFLINCKVPQHERDRVPLVTTREEEIVWVVGKRIAQPFRLTDAAGPALHLRAAALEREDD
jgi:tRNA(Ile)-lysidine synthase